MRRRLFNILAAASTMLCVAMIALWVRSCWYADLGWVRFYNRDSTICHQLILDAGSGDFQFESYTLDPVNPGRFSRYRVRNAAGSIDSSE